jgi:hypothetical protein
MMEEAESCGNVLAWSCIAAVRGDRCGCVDMFKGPANLRPTDFVDVSVSTDALLHHDFRQQ